MKNGRTLTLLRKAIYIQRNTEVRSRYGCCRAKPIRITYYECVCICILGLVIRHANSIFSASYYTVICGLSSYTRFFCNNS